MFIIEKGTTPYGKLRTKKAQEEKKKREERKKAAFYTYLTIIQ